MNSLETIVAENKLAVKKAPRRSPQLTVVTTSEVQAFRDCANKHHFRYRERLRPKAEGKHLATGSIFHGGMSAGIQAAFHPSMLASPTVARLDMAIQASVAKIDTRFMEWAATVVEHVKDVDFDGLERDAVDGTEMVKWMLENYFRSTALDLMELRLVETERAFDVVIRNRIGSRTKLHFKGVRDAVFYDPRYNAVVLHEHKTVSSAPSDIGKRAEMDPQTCGYVYSLLEQHREGALWYTEADGTSRPVPNDADIGRVAYNACRKKKPSTPKINQDGTVSAAQIDTLWPIYEAALVDQVQRTGKPVTDKQRVLLEGLKGKTDSFFYRHEFQRNAAEIERWRSDTFVDASRIRAADTDPAMRTRNPGNCAMAWSMPCEYRQVCIDDRPELRSMFRVADTAHTEVREAEEEEHQQASAYVAPF